MSGISIPRLLAEAVRDDDSTSRLAALRHCFAAQQWQPDGDEAAGVLLALTEGLGAPEMILTRRADHLRQHAGEVAFPGGWREAGDATLLATALRETQEELGVAPAQVEVLGRLPTTRTRRTVSVACFIGIVPAGLELALNPTELSAVFCVPLRFFCQDNLLADDFEYQGCRRLVPRFEFEGYDIWGMTANLICSFCAVSAQSVLDVARVPAAGVRRH